MINLAAYMDHTLLKPESRDSDYNRIVSECNEYGFKSICVSSGWVEYVADKLKDSPTAVCSVVGFPLGASSSESKVFEARHAVAKGASEVDMVINIGALLSGAHDWVGADIKAVREAMKPDVVLKVILETCVLSDNQKVTACEIAVSSGADFVKTSTGFSSGGATVEDVALMRRTVGEHIGVKASGGIRTWQAAFSMIEAGANRLGTGASVQIIEGKTAQAD